MLPVIATLAMAALSRQTASTGAAGNVSAASMTDNIGGLASFLDMNKDGSMVDDVAGFVGKLFGESSAARIGFWYSPRPT